MGRNFKIIDGKTYCVRGHEITESNLYRGQCNVCRLKGKKEYDSKYNYGLSLSEKQTILDLQDNKCAICGRSDCHWGKGFQDVWHLDYNHETNKNRDVLCAKCNTALGRLEPFLEQTMEYLEKYNNKEEL